MVNLKRFTTRYKGAEDRILFTGEDKNGETVSLWLTQRLLLKIIPVLVDWLQKNNPADLKARENSTQAQEIAEVFTRKPVLPKVAVTPAQPADSTPVEIIEDAVLVHSIDLNLNQKMLRLRFRHCDQELGNLALNSSQLRQWLAVVHVLWKNADWPAHIWPRWLSEDAKLVANQTQGAFH
ncbi:MAG: hypothetical protein KJN90_12975 [Gammaproteobacteria bacterium]|nr:hypothetical protein [Gammaproteobacteria bacterium]